MFVKGGTIIFRQKKKKGKKSTLLLCQIPAVAGEFIPSPTRDLISYLVLYIFAFSLMTKNNNLKMWFHIETWHNAQLLKFYRNSLLLFPRAWSKFTRNPRARQLHFFTSFSSFSSCIARWAMGPRTAYSTRFTLGFMLSKVSTLPRHETPFTVCWDMFFVMSRARRFPPISET